jgi:quinol monooxygenase YgiN
MQLRETVTPVEYAYSPLSLDNSLTTVIAFFPTRDAEHQQAFTRAFQSQVMPVLNEEGGFVCSHLFQALDGTKMALYEQWTSYEECIAAYAPTSRSTIVREQTKSVLEIDGKSVDRHVYEVRAEYLVRCGPFYFPVVLLPCRCCCS